MSSPRSRARSRRRAAQARVVLRVWGVRDSSEGSSVCAVPAPVHLSPGAGPVAWRASRPRAYGHRITKRSTTGTAAAGSDSLSQYLAEIGRHPLLTRAEEVVLAKRIEAGDAAARDRMVESNLRLVVVLARAYA